MPYVYDFPSAMDPHLVTASFLIVIMTSGDDDKSRERSRVGAKHTLNSWNEAKGIDSEDTVAVPLGLSHLIG